MADKDDDKDKNEAKKVRGTRRPEEAPVDLAARIGARTAPEPPPPAPAPLAPQRLDGPLPPRVDSGRRPNPERPTIIGMDEPPPPQIFVPASPKDESLKPSGAIRSPRTPPGPGETDVVATPLLTPDDWHHFELALRKVHGVGQIRTEYYRHGVLKVRVTYAGEGRLAQALREGVPGYRIRVLGENRSTLQILVSTGNDQRRPG